MLLISRQARILLIFFTVMFPLLPIVPVPSVKAADEPTTLFETDIHDGASDTAMSALSDSNALVVLTTPYNSVPVGEVWYDTNGEPIQAHGGGFLKHDGWYYWVGEDKSNNSSSEGGINLYRSKDLLNWEFVSTILSDTTNPGFTTGSPPGLKDPTTGKFTLERPKLLYNEASGQFVLWAHWENGEDYGSAHLLVATASSVDGPYTIVRNFRPGKGYVGDPEQIDPTYTGTDGLWGYASRDFTVYKDPDSGEGYLISTQDWTTMRLYKLTENYTNVDWQNSYPLFIGGRREAPAMIKADGVYYLITSSQSGWYPNQAMYSYTTDIDDPDGWSPLQPVGNNTTFYSQPTYIMEIDAADGTKQYVYMGDRWNPKALGASTYVWLPLRIDSSTHTMTMDYVPGWMMDPVTGKFVYPEVSLVSQGKPVEGEDNVVEGKLLKYVNDGYYAEPDTWAPDTPYYQQNKVPYSVTIDLQEVYDLSRVDISFKQFNGSEAYYQYTVQGSNDNKHWIVLADETQNKTVGFKSNTLNGKYRYVKLYVTAVKNAHNDNSTADWANGLLEVQVYANNLSKPIAPLPVASLEGGTYTSDQTVTLSSPVSGAQIYYTTDGTEPTDRSTPYTGPISLTLGRTILKAVVYADGMEPSGVLTKEFNIINPDDIVAVVGPTEFAVTADEGASGLPATLEAMNALGDTVQAPVIWNTEGVTFSPYTSVQITGTLPGGYQVNAKVDVVNADTIYLISCGSQGNSSFFAAAKARLGNQLVNAVSDQAFDGQWGYTGTIGTDIGYHTNAEDLYESGWWAYSNKSIDYMIHLDPGTYTVISGYREWWGATRYMTFSAKAEDGTVLASQNFTINKTTTAHQEKLEFTLFEPETVQISVSKAGGSDPVLAWLAVEKKIPITTAALSPALPDGNQGWYVSPITLTFTVVEQAQSVASTVYSYDNGNTWNIYTDPIFIDQDGIYTVSFYSTDVAGASEYPKTVTFKLDQTAPTSTASPNSAKPIQSGKYSAPVTVTLNAADNLSGVAMTFYRTNGQTWQTYTGPVVFDHEGQYMLEYYSVDNAGNSEAPQSLELNVITDSGEEPPSPTPSPTPSPMPTPAPIPVPTPTPVPQVIGNKVAVEATISANGKANVQINADALAEAMQKSENHTVAIEVKSVESAQAVEVNLPARQILSSASNNVNQIEVNTGLATVRLSTELLANHIGESASNVQLTVSKVNPSELPEETKRKIGSNTVYDFSLNVDGEKIETFGGYHTIKVLLPYNLRSGDDPEKVVVYSIDVSGTLQTVQNGKYNPSNGMVEFYPKHFGQYTAAVANVTFQDLARVPWAKSAIEGLAAREVLHGIGKERFNPNGTVTRAQFIQMLIKALDLENDNSVATFADVKPGAWYYKSIATAQQLGIITGMEDGSFGIDEPISRQDMAVMMYRAVKALNISLPDSKPAVSFLDREMIASYASDAVAAMQQAGIINGFGNGKFAPKDFATRAQAAVMIYNLFKLI